ncbi:MAG: hypothetical protein NVS1B11_17730 [Terriglobales bacterium]
MYPARLLTSIRHLTIFVILGFLRFSAPNVGEEASAWIAHAGGKDEEAVAVLSSLANKKLSAQMFSSIQRYMRPGSVLLLNGMEFRFRLTNFLPKNSLNQVHDQRLVPVS